MKEEQGMVDLLEYALKIGERKYDEERDREDALISQASQMQTVFSIVTAVLLGAAAIFADHRGNIPTLFFIISISIIIATIGASLVLSSIVQWRFKTQVLPDLSELRKYTFESEEWESITGKTAQQKQYYQLLQDVQTEKCRLNDRRVRLIIASIICFWASIAESVIAFIIGLYLITI